VAERVTVGTDPVIHEDDVQVYETDQGSFTSRRRLLGLATGARLLGCSLYELPPGRRSFPYHWHAANEEALYILEGEGMLRLGGREVPIRAGCYAALRTGEDGAHQVLNTSTTTLRYLCFSTMIEPDVAHYPDSEKLAVFLGGAPGSLEAKVTTLPAGAECDYWHGGLKR
jgi:uncharacterized cupin superfamily protein